jgi:hypothetical protein
MLTLKRALAAAAVPALLLAAAPAEAATAGAARFTGAKHTYATVSDGLAVSATGLQRGFTSSTDDTDGTGVSDVLTYFEERANGFYAKKTTYKGLVVDVAWDSTGTWVLYRESVGGLLRLGKITTQLEESTPITVDSAPSQWGTLAVRGGQWWAVWTRTSDQHLWQSGTLTTAAPAPVTGIEGVHDVLPDMSIWGSGSAARAVLVWARGTGEASQQIKIAEAPLQGSWTSRTLSATGYQIGAPSVALYDAVYVAWNKDGALAVADNKSGKFVSRTLGPMVSGQPRAAVSRGIFFATTGGVVWARGAGGWTSASSTSPLTALSAAGGKALVLQAKSDRSVQSRAVAP